MTILCVCGWVSTSTSAWVHSCRIQRLMSGVSPSNTFCLSFWTECSSSWLGWLAIKPVFLSLSSQLWGPRLRPPYPLRTWCWDVNSGFCAWIMPQTPHSAFSLFALAHPSCPCLCLPNMAFVDLCLSLLELCIQSCSPHGFSSMFLIFWFLFFFTFTQVSFCFHVSWHI